MLVNNSGLEWGIDFWLKSKIGDGNWENTDMGRVFNVRAAHPPPKTLGSTN